MKRSAWRLALAAVLFVGWISYLAYLAATTTDPIVLARPQFLTAQLYVIGRISSETPVEIVTVQEVVWAADAADLKLGKITVKNLPKCGMKEQPKGEFVWPGAGDYILALSHTKNAGVFTVTLRPRTPGFAGHAVLAQIEMVGAPIYPVTPQTLEQLQNIKAQYHP
jgi:hypothetical protein